MVKIGLTEKGRISAVSVDGGDAWILSDGGWRYVGFPVLPMISEEKTRAILDWVKSAAPPSRAN